MNTAQPARHDSGAVSPRPRATMLAVLATLATAQAAAFEVDTGQPDLKLRWDNTIKYSNSFRIHQRDGTLTPSSGAGVAAAINQDDGDRNFDRGLISNRFDLLSEADLAYHGFGARVSGAAWYDSVYMNHDDNDSVGLLGPGSSTSNSDRGVNQFTTRTRDLQGSKAEILDAFAYGRFDAGDTSTTVRLGQHALVWGESLFLGSNAIAGAQNATDIARAVSVPNTQVREIVRPVPQISLQTILTPVVSVGAYYQFRYVPNRLPGVGSYFSNTDIAQDGRGYAYGAGGAHVPINVLPVKNSGQGGVQVKLALGATDIGIYALRFHDKSLIPYAVIGLPPGGGAPGPTSFEISHKQDITALGASFSQTLGDLQVAGEASTRRNAAIPSALGADTNALIPGAAPHNNGDNPVVPVGNTAHANLSAVWAVPPTPAWASATLLAELAWNRLLDCEKNCNLLPATGTRDAWQMVAVMSPSYNQVIPGLNLSVPVGLAYTPRRSRSLALGPGPSGPENGGSVNVGVQGLYLDAWRFSASYVHYFGKADLGITTDFTYKQTLLDRDFLSFSVARTF